MTHPMQEVYRDGHGTARFRCNEIVRFLLDAGPFDMNKLAIMKFSREDRAQFAQLIGYSVSGFCELSYVEEYDMDRAEEDAAELALPPGDHPGSRA